MRYECEVSIITINYNGLEETCALLDTLPVVLSQEIIVVDNHSAEDEASIISARYPHVKVVRSNQNLGFAGGNNLGIKAAHGKYLFFINNDTEIKDDWNVNALIERMESNPGIGMVCPKIRFFWDSRPIQFAGYTHLSSITMRNRSIGFGEEDSGQYDTPHPTPYAHGAAMMAKREAIEKVGMMPECFFLYYEELDWSEMFTRAGYEIWYEPACTIYHKESQATGQNSPLRTYYITRNRLLFARRNMSFPRRHLCYTYLIGLVALRDILKYTITRQFSLLRATLHGISDFIRGRQGMKTN